MAKKFFLMFLVMAFLVPQVVLADDTEAFQVEAEIVANVSVTEVDFLDFGTIIQPPAVPPGGYPITYVMDTADTGTWSTAPTTYSLAGDPGNSAEFDVVGFDATPFRVFVDDATTTLNAGELTVTTWICDDGTGGPGAMGTDYAGGYNAVLVGGTCTLMVGATLNVLAQPTVGAYSVANTLNVEF